MDFFTRQEQTRRTTRFLVVAFLGAFAAIVLATTAVTAAVVRFYSASSSFPASNESFDQWLLAHSALFGLIAVGTLLCMSLASLYRMASLSRGGAQVARLLGATEITGDTTDPLRRRLINVVEEMSIASGVPVPDVYVLEQEPGINAFAAGLTPADAAVAVTRGALERLDRAELQGVVAHEFSHILNGDMRLNQQLMGLSFGVLVLSLIGRWLLRTAHVGRRGRHGGGTAAALVLGVAFALIGAIGLFFSRMIKAAVSRQREMLADASAVQFTRESSALASALKKIGGYTARLSSVDSEEVAHMLFERGSRSFSGWFATHPPLVDRIRALEPGFDPRDYPSPDTAMQSPRPTESVPLSAAAEAGVQALAAGGGAEARSSRAEATGSGAEARSSRAEAAGADPLLERIGEIAPSEVGGDLRAALPEELYHAAHSRESSLLLVLALALSPAANVREQQLSVLDAQLGSGRAHRCATLRTELDRLDPELRIPILALLMPALKQRPAEQLEYLFRLVERLTQANPDQRLFDYVLLRMLAAYLTELPLAPLAAKADRKLSTSDAVGALLAVVAGYGHETTEEARAALRAGLASLAGTRHTKSSNHAKSSKTVARLPGAEEQTSASDAPTRLRDLARLDDALARLAGLRPSGKRAVLEAVLVTIRHDRRIGIEEVELFRAIAAVLGCPSPPARESEIPAADADWTGAR